MSGKITSINFQNVKMNSFDHNKRIEKPTYLLDHNSDRNSDKNYREYLEKYTDENGKEKTRVSTDLFSEYENIYKTKNKQKMQPSQKKSLIKEAVITIKKDTTIQDIENLFQKFSDTHGGGFEIMDISLHFDEGVFVRTNLNIDDLTYNHEKQKWLNADGDDVTNQCLTYRPGKNIFYNENDGSWYKEKEFENKIDTSKFQKYYNNHAHVVTSFFNKETGKSLRLNRTQMAELQTITAEVLGMERGKEWSNNTRKNHYQTKKEADIVDQLTRKENRSLNKEIAKVKDLKKEIKELKEEVATTRADHAKIEQLNRDLKAQMDQKELTITELKELIKIERDTFLFESKQKDQEIQNLKEQLKEEKISEYDLGNKTLTKDELIDYLFAENDKKDREIGELKEKLTTLQKKNSMYLGMNNDLKNEINSLKTQINSLESKNDEYEGIDTVNSFLADREPSEALKEIMEQYGKNEDEEEEHKITYLDR